MTVSEYCEPGLLDKLLNYRYYAVTPLFFVYLHIAVEGPNLQVRAGVLQMPPPPSSPTWSPRSSRATFAPNAYADPTRMGGSRFWHSNKLLLQVAVIHILSLLCGDAT